MPVSLNELQTQQTPHSQLPSLAAVIMATSTNMDQQVNAQMQHTFQSKQSDSTMAQNPFERLPGEVRNQIYKLCDVCPGPRFEVFRTFKIDILHRHRNRLQPPISRVCRLLRREAFGFYETQHCWRFDLTFVDCRRNLEKWVYSVGDRPLLMQHIAIFWGERYGAFTSEIRLDLSSNSTGSRVTSCNDTADCFDKEDKATFDAKLLNMESRFRAIADAWTRKRERGELRAEDLSSVFKETFPRFGPQAL